jgi:hypothetical protein
MTHYETDLDIALRMAVKRARQLEREHPGCQINLRKVILVADDVTLEDEWGYAIVKSREDGKEECMEYVESGFTWDKNWPRIIDKARSQGTNFRILVPEYVLPWLLGRHPEVSDRLICYDSKENIVVPHHMDEKIGAYS